MSKISEKIRYVGVNDNKKVIFEGLWPLPYGVSYNSYIIVDEKIALVDTVEADFAEEFLSNIKSEIGDRPVDYLIVNHMEPDHSSLIAFIRKHYPQICIVTSQKAVAMIQGYYGVSDNIMTVKDGDTLTLGDTVLSFHLTPMVHWPETMMTYLQQEHTLFSGDAFGTFGAVKGHITDSSAALYGSAENSGDSFRDFNDEMLRYYSNIVGKYGIPVQNALKKLSGFTIDRICSTHGPVWEHQISETVSLYDRMSRYEGERGVCIVYASMYGNTEKAAKALEAELVKKGVRYAIHNLSTENVSFAYRDAFRYDTLAIGSPTYNTEIFPPVNSFITGLAGRGLKNRRFFAFGSYTWAGTSVKLLNEFAQKQGFELISEGVSFAQGYSDDKFSVPENL